MTPRLAIVPELESELDRLYASPLDAFTSTRNELAARLKKAGQADAAEQVRALRKPSVAVWAVNRLAGERPADVRALVDSAAALRTAQEKALRGRGGDAMREATRTERDALRSLTRAAERLLAAEGRSTSASVLERVSATLRAAAVDEATARLLVAGRLPEEVRTSGFEAVEALAPASPRKRGGKPTRGDAAAKREREQRLRRLRAEVEQAERRAAAAEGKARSTEDAATAAREEARAARAAAGEATAALTAAERSRD